MEFDRIGCCMGNDLQKGKFSNGVRLLLVPMEGIESVATAVMVGVGSRYETPALNGVSHFIEHMVFKGTKKYPTTDAVNVVEKMGGLQNAYTDIDLTSYHNKVLSTDWEKALEINKELVLAPRLEQVYLERERGVILEEMKRYEDEPAAKAEEVYHKMLYPGSSLGMRVIGEEESVGSLTGETLHTFHYQWYMPERIVVVLAGNLKSQISKIKEIVTEWFGSLPGKTNDSFAPVFENQREPRLEVVTKPEAQQAHLILGVRTFARQSDERFAWNLFNLIMGVSFTSRLFKEIREKRGLCYQIRSGSDNWHDVGNWSIYAGVATEKVGEAVRAILDELAKARDGGVTEEELRIAKKRLATMLAFKSEDPEFFVEFYGRQEVYGMPILTLEDYLKRNDAVTIDQVNTLAKKYLRTETLNLALVWRKQRDEELFRMLGM